MKKILDFTVKENRRLNADNFLLVLHSIELPEIQAGQFVNVRVDHSPSTFLRRPISVHDVDKKQGLLYLLVKIAGKGTEKLSTLKPGKLLLSTRTRTMFTGWWRCRYRSPFAFIQRTLR